MGRAMCLRMIHCGWPKVRIIEPNGHERHFSMPFAIPDLLHLYPHHCVHHVSGSILSPDAELQGGHTYQLSPMPSLFPSSSSSSSPNRHLCSCFLNKKEEEDDTIIGSRCSSIWKPRDPLRAQRGSNPRLFSRTSTQGRDKRHNGSNKTLRRARSWQPSLDMISENNALMQTKDDQWVKKMEKKMAKPHKYTFNQNAWNVDGASNLHRLCCLPVSCYNVTEATIHPLKSK